MADRALYRLADMKESISKIMRLLIDKTYEDILFDEVIRAAYERYLEVLSEASKHIPDEWKAEHPKIEWSNIANIGNHLRHAYHKTDYEILWNIYANHLGALEDAVDALIQANRRSQP